jgi:hypothetical protein
MAKNVTARQQSGWLVISLAPDVCKTPMGSSVVPIPYPVIAKLEAASSVEPTVRANGYPLVVYDKSFVPTTIGDTAGSATGIKSSTVGGKCYPADKSPSVRAGGKYIVRHDDRFYMNGS